MGEPYLTSIDVEGWSIDDGEAAHLESPETYWIPPLSKRQSLEPGALAKLRFYIRAPDESGKSVDHGERMWVQVVEKKGNWYFGKLDNDPYCTDEICAGLELWFQPRHVIDIYDTE
ncbi:MAG: DUF2314 domain-containing protein [Rhodanobacteraceae bacterium]|nr:DUF2314 domain-containing protein [Rhodanobacteraceae bacterium]MBL0041933.1 DUF2314 domain-containing protein [Xanthomonadales bacterium]MBP6077809.1 hypothetical protein [Xanthomonadales bacterium]MBP7623222.1 hypothetical protein [Xanthomonadales bacterium]